MKPSAPLAPFSSAGIKRTGLNVFAMTTKSVIALHASDLCTRIRPSIGTENLVPEEVNYTKIAIRVTVMHKVQFLLASEPRKPLKPRSLYVSTKTCA
jgi:hypothetical protein